MGLIPEVLRPRLRSSERSSSTLSLLAIAKTVKLTGDFGGKLKESFKTAKWSVGFRKREL